MKDKFVVNLRDLHVLLEIKEPFEEWIEKVIKENGLVEGKDYVTHTVYEDDEVAH